MLNAILGGKAGRAELNGQSISWASVYQSSEDLLTATVFERLAYLPTGLMWRLLRDSTFTKGVLPVSLGELVQTRFWPVHTHPDNGQVIPDVVIGLDRGALIVEAKRFDHDYQYAEQWAREWAAFFHERAKDNVADTPGGEEVYLLAIGGFEKNDPGRVSDMIKSAQELLSNVKGKAPPLRVVACRWGGFADGIRAVRKARQGIWDYSGLRAVIADLDAALEFHGYGPGTWLEDLTNDNWTTIDNLAGALNLLRPTQINQPAPPASDWGQLSELIPVKVGTNDLRRLQQ
ncbi:MAG: hypothetical protein ACLQME_15865 [Alphaproteobacteria bacterium]